MPPLSFLIHCIVIGSKESLHWMTCSL
jgi:hypothetical protein